ncbi:uncharacterized protein LOC119576702 [Penaeus monodon]|uniref:uncharacterized protein LOC119576702 n=1 Tax=Penaeus monodon TaxID=6687 RepID=UPI0018A7DD41|nr:uncharacterized protein LOC119576702 [Penaeus monodon]
MPLWSFTELSNLMDIVALWDTFKHITLDVASDFIGKVLAHILRCIRDYLLRHQRPEQSRFTPGWSAIYLITVLRVFVEHPCESGHGLFAAYIDLKKAFDTVHHKSLWKILTLRGIPTRIIGLISSLYTDTENVVKCSGGLFSLFPMNSGVKQSCVLAPTVSNTCMDWILGKATIQNHCVSTLANIMVTDDVAFLESEKPSGGSRCIYK